MHTIEEIFKTKKPIIGMLHLGHLCGKEFRGIDDISSNAIKDIEALQDGGINAILIENWKEESRDIFVNKDTEKNIYKVMEKLIKVLKVPFGFNILNNDYKLAFKLAKEFKGSFIELDVFVDKVQSDFTNNKDAKENPFIVDPKPNEIWQFAKSIEAENIPLFCFVQPKHYKMPENKDIKQSVREAIDNNASAVLITKATGSAPTVELIKRAKEEAQAFPVGIGSGFSFENAKDILPHVDFAVVGTSIKINNKTDNPVDETKVRSLMSVVSNFQ